MTESMDTKLEFCKAIGNLVTQAEVTLKSVIDKENHILKRILQS